MTDKFTQKRQIVRYIKTHGSISTLEATNDLKIMSLGRRLTDLKNDGYVFGKEWVKGSTAGVNFIKYTIISEPKEES